MRRVIGAIAILLAILPWYTEAQAACTTQTYFLPDGRVVICTVCCDSGGNCTTSCV